MFVQKKSSIQIKNPKSSKWSCDGLSMKPRRVLEHLRQKPHNKPTADRGPTQTAVNRRRPPSQEISFKM